MNPKWIPSVESPRHVTQGQVKRTLRGMDGRIRHVETLASRWETRKIEEACAAAVKSALAPLVAEVAALTARVAALEPSPADGASAS